MATRIRIAARLRPFLSGEIEDSTVGIHREEDESSSVTIAHPRDQTQRFKFPFSSCHGQESTQDEIYEKDVRPLIDVVYSGISVTVFAYGVTSSGKTHTMQGSKSQPGIIPRVVKDLFARVQSMSNFETTISMSYMEIYKEDAYDLLVDRDSAPKLPIRENEAGQVFVAHLSTRPVTSSADFDAAYAAATKRRSTGPTNLNRASSRSHAILTLYVQVVDNVAGQTMTGKINLVDLAGSENNKLTGNDPSRMAESSAINKSLSVLGQVVHALNQGASRIPYRNSKLTRILQDALGGTSVGLLICNLAPGARFRQDTWNTLNLKDQADLFLSSFATRTKEIENHPVVNIRDLHSQSKQSSVSLTVQPARSSIAKAIAASDSNAPSSRRPSLLPSAGPSRLPAPTRGRPSTLGIQLGNNFQSFAIAPQPQLEKRASDVAAQAEISVGIRMTEQEIDERISRAVEIEVARRLEERERQRQAEEGEKEAARRESEASAQEDASSQQISPLAETSLSQQHTSTLPSGVLTPYLQQHQDLDVELKRRLADLEQKYEQNSQELQLADVLSPFSKKKTGRAYVALARAHSEKGNLKVALDLYRKAEAYVPDNIKLKERVIEIEYAVKNGVPYIPEPKKRKTKYKNKIKDVASPRKNEANMIKDSDTVDCQNERLPLGEFTNISSKHKRAAENDAACLVTPPKKPRRDKAYAYENYEEEALTNAPI